MKKSIIALGALIVAFSFSSCRGNYTCTCTFNNAVVYEQESNQRSDAETDCNLKKTTVAGATWDCDVN